MLEQTHSGRLVKDQNGRSRLVYTRTRSTQLEMENFRLGPLAILQKLEDPLLNNHLDSSVLVVQTSQDIALRAILTRIQKDRSSHRLLTGTQIVHAFLNNKDYLEAYPQFNQLFILFGYQEHGNRRLAEFITELVSSRRLAPRHVWLFIPKSIVDMAAQWGDAILNLRFLPTIRLDISGNTGPVSTGRVGWEPREARNSNDSQPSPSLPQDGVFQDPKFIPKSPRLRY